MVHGPGVITAEGEEFVSDLDAGFNQMLIRDSAEIHRFVQFESKRERWFGECDDSVRHSGLLLESHSL